jgi:hypothetical protein
VVDVGIPKLSSPLMRIGVRTAVATTIGRGHRNRCVTAQ